MPNNQTKMINRTRDNSLFTDNMSNSKILSINIQLNDAILALRFFI